ncbi:NAD-dependent succinate-semialdehyde dehydrogenase [Conexibacter stalactiti]|uniref:NAD-dependent succinate-semialdehyde dehydrogenase n=1 Tax=Conexibacter stalactiti TaxID=1940611 RepID=A0ABU4HZH3_9ACTN|nr:NAD-dependent succinate-semialdehyde dehydrogenase [Conexibacter stalactiti]MDW5598731.1 NAD-dependent succinate-semialdehyde dehydrogenase [Conexibacter stalactiti]MEC5039373.1 NAD-dependent succinate-semialdehyde dehydrogenase [Conexibacter stalactiti]
MTTAIAHLTDQNLLRDELYVGGVWTPGAGGEHAPVLDPASGDELARVAEGTRADARRAIDAAAVALPKWSRLSAKERARLMRRWYELIVEHVDDLAVLLTAEQGKPLAEARGEVLYGAGFVEWYAEEGKRAYGDVIPTNDSGRRLFAIRQPIGVCAAITPWNFPMAMIARKVAPALGAGCTIVVKPAPSTPLSALALAELADRAGIPAGVINVVTGPAEEVGHELATNPAVRKLTFTGSTPVGRLLMSQAADTVKKVSLELGGNAPFIVFDDADLDAAVAGAIASKFRNAGQTCVCANRVLVQAGIHDAFVERFAAATAALKVADGFTDGAEQGPLIDARALAKVKDHIADALAHGASVATGGDSHELGGTFFQPTVLTGATTAMKIAAEETFGPVAPVFRFETEAEAIELANATESGLAAYLYTRDSGRVWRVGEALEFGVVGVNTGAISYEGAPFGGVKQSGLGREGSRHGLDDFMELKYLCLDGIS